MGNGSMGARPTSRLKWCPYQKEVWYGGSGIVPSSGVGVVIEQRNRSSDVANMTKPSNRPGRSSEHERWPPEPVVDRHIPSGASLRRHQNTSLLEWMWLIAIERRDAFVTVQTSGGEGGIWCVGGNIIDARYATLDGDDAVYELLTLETGDFSVGFGRIERPRTVTMPTEALLLEVARRKERRASIAPPAPRVSTPPTSEHTQVATYRPAANRDWLQQIAAVAALGAIGVAGWQMLAPSSPSPKAGPGAESSTASQLAIRPVVPGDLFVDIEVEPDRAGIWLDGERVGTGHLRQEVPRDGRTHELRLAAPGFAAQSLVFREEAPSRLVRLERLVGEPSIGGAPAQLPAAGAPVVSLPATTSGDEERRRALVEHPAPPAPARAAPLVGKEAAAAHSVDLVAAKPKGSSTGDVDPAKPRVQVISDRDIAKPRVQIVDAPEASRMKVQIIDNDSPRVQVIE